MIKLLNLPWNPPPAMKRGTAKESGSESGRNRGTHSFSGSKNLARYFNRSRKGKVERKRQIIDRNMIYIYNILVYRNYITYRYDDNSNFIAILLQNVLLEAKMR